MRILIKFASRSRPQKFFNCLDNIISNCESKDFKILASLDIDDETMNNETVIEKLKTYECLDYFFGFSKNKIDAVNRDMDLSGKWDILINTSDDMWFVQKGFDEQIRKDMLTHFPDLDGVLHYNDGFQGQNCMTMSIMGRKYYERDNFIYNPVFESLWSDVVAQETAIVRGKYKYIGDDRILFNHLHPSFGVAEYDKQYLSTEGMEVRQRDYNRYLELKKEYDKEGAFKVRSI